MVVLETLQKPTVKKTVFHAQTGLHTLYYVIMGISEKGALGWICICLAGLTVCIGWIYKDYYASDQRTVEAAQR